MEQQQLENTVRRWAARQGARRTGKKRRRIDGGHGEPNPGVAPAQATVRHRLTCRLQRESRENVIVEFADDQGAWQFIRIAHLNVPAGKDALDLGLYACCPTEGRLRFETLIFSASCAHHLAAQKRLLLSSTTPSPFIRGHQRRIPAMYSGRWHRLSPRKLDTAIRFSNLIYAPNEKINVSGCTFARQHALFAAAVSRNQKPLQVKPPSTARVWPVM